MKRRLRAWLSVALLVLLFGGFVNAQSDVVYANNGRVINQRQMSYPHDRPLIDGDFYWTSSRVREWLHSTSTNPPYTNRGTVTRQTRGFLSGFTTTEISQMAITRRKTPVRHDWAGGLTTAERIGSTNFSGDDGLPSMLPYSLRYQGHPDGPGDPMVYNNWRSTITHDRVFLPTAWELQRYVESRGWSMARGNTDGAGGTDAGYWLGGTQTYTGSISRGVYITDDGRVMHGRMRAANRGIVPMLHLKPNAAVGQNKRIGDTFQFGRYTSDNPEGHRGNIMWRVVNETPDGYKLIMAEHAVDHFQYNVDPGGDSNNAVFTRSNHVNFSGYDIDISTDLKFQNTNASGTYITGNPNQPWFRVVNTAEFYRRNIVGARFRIQGQDVSGRSIDTVWAGGNFVRGTNIIDYNLHQNDPGGRDTVITIQNDRNVFMKGHLPFNMIDEPVDLDVEYDLPYNGYASNNQYVDIDVGLSNWNVDHFIPRLTSRISGDGGVTIFTPPPHTTYAGTRYRMSGRMRVTDWGDMHSALSASQWSSQGLVHLTYSTVSVQPRWLHDMYLPGASYNSRGMASNPSHGYDGSVGAVDPAFFMSWARLRDAPGAGWVNFSTVMPVPQSWLQFSGRLGFHAFPNMSTLQAQGPEIEIENLTLELIDDQMFKLQSLHLPNGQTINNPPVGSMHRHRVTSTGNYAFRARDTRGYDWHATANVRIDKSAPTGTFTQSPSATTLTNGNVTLTLDSRDDETGLSKVEYIGGGTVTSQNIPSINQDAFVQTNRSTFTVTQNGTYRFRLTDRVGNTREVTHTVGNIDRLAPTTSVSQTPTGWTNQDVTVNWTANAQGLSDLRRVRFDDGSGWSAWTNTSGRTQSFNRTVTGNLTAQFQVEDVAGNVATRSHTVSNIDKTLPNGTITGNPTSWQNTNATLTFNATDTGGSGVRRVRIAGGTWVNGSTTSQIAPANGKYSFDVEDNAGNVRTVSVQVNYIDKALPNGTITGNPTSWQNTNATLTFNATDTGGSGVRRVRIAGGSWVNGSTTTQTATANGSYSFEVEDNAGNTRTVSVTVNRIDKDVPNGTITGNPTSWQNTNATLTFNATDTGGSGVRRVRIAGGTWVNGSTTTQTATANGTYSFEVEDNAGNTRTVSVSVTRIDKDVPNGTITGNPTSWQNTDATLTFNATDTGGSGVSRVRIAGGTWVNGSTTTQTATANGTYSFEVEDHAGNTRTVSVAVNRIDKDVPNGTITGNPTSWQNTNATLTFNATDVGSGVRRVRIAGGTWVNGSTTTQTATANGSYSFEVEDNAGNTRTVSVTVNRIDKDVPNGTITGNPTSWQNTNATLTFNATDTGGSGVRRVRIAGGTWVNGSTTTQTATANGTYSFEVEDNAGNTRTVSVTVNRIDKDVPNGTITGNPTSWQNTNATLTFNATDTGGSGVRRVRIAGGTWVNGSTTTQTATANGTYSFEVEDNAGNTRTVSATVNRIDKDVPNGTITGNPTSWQNTNATLTFNATDTGGSGVSRVRIAGGTWVNGSTTTQTATANGTYSFEVEDHAGNTRTVSVTVNRIDKELPSGSISQTPTSWTNGNVTLTFNATDTGGSGVSRVRQAGGTWVSGSTTTQTVTSNGTYSFEVQDHAGNTSTRSHTVTNIDKVLPNANSTQSPTAWTNGNVTITWTASATGSPLSRVRTHDGSTWGAWSTVSGTTASTTQTVTANGTYHYQIEDQAGNVRQISHTVTNIDKVLPDATSSQSPVNWTNGNVTITWNASATGSPLQQVRTHNGSTWSGWTTISGTSRTQTQVVSSNGTYQFQVQDAAGNVRQISHTVNNIDKGSPHIQSSQSPTAWTNGNVTLTIGARDFGELNNQSTRISGIASIQVRRPDGTTWSDTYGAPSEHSTVYHNRTFTATENGTYTVTVIDRAGNTATHTHAVTNIDRALPTGSTTHMSDWTNGNVWIDVTGHDAVSGLASITYISGGTVTGNTEFTFNGPITSQTARFTATQNGTYTFEIRDRAGNTRRVTQTVSNIDRTQPEATTRLNPTSWTNQNVGIIISGRDLNNQGSRISGVDRIRLRRAGASSWMETMTINDSTESNPVFADRTFTVTDNGVYEFELRDRAGNTTIVRQTVDKIDRTPPTASGTFVPNGWTNQNITVTWVGERAGTPSSPLRRYRTHNGTAWSAWQNAANPDRITVNQTVSSNGTYRFEIQDEAGNVRQASVTVTQYDNVAPTGNIRARFDRAEHEVIDDSVVNVNMIDRQRVTVDVFDVEDLGISGVEFIEIEEQRRIGSIDSLTGSTVNNWQTVETYRYNWPDPYSVSSQTYHIDAAHALDTRFVLVVQDRAGNRSTHATSNPVRHSVLQFDDLRITDVVNPELTQAEVDALRDIDLNLDTVPVTAGTNVTFDLTYILRHLDRVERVVGDIVVSVVDDSNTITPITQIQIDEPKTGHNQLRTITRTFTVPEGTPRDATIQIYGNLMAEMENGSQHMIWYPNNDRIGSIIGSVDNHLEEFFRFRIVK